MSKEADFGILFRHWVKAYCPLAGGYELKDTRGKDYFVMSEWKESQRFHALASTTSKGNLIRVQAGTIGAPDYVYLKRMDSYVVIKFPDFFAVFNAELLLYFPHKKMTAAQARASCMILVETKKTR